MVHGSPDWWGNIPSATVYGGLDTGELAVRMGSCNSFDRRGNVVWMDDFENGLGPWSWSGSGANNAVHLCTEVTLRGSLAGLLHLGEEDDGFATIERSLPYPVLGGIGIEAAFVPQENMKHVSVTLFLYDGAEMRQYQATYDHVNGLVKVKIVGGAETPVGSPGVQEEGYHNHCIMKMVANSATGKYARVLFNDNTYDASAHTVYVDPDLVTKPLMAARVLACNTGVHLVDVSVDCVIVTQNESV